MEAEFVKMEVIDLARFRAVIANAVLT